VFGPSQHHNGDNQVKSIDLIRAAALSAVFAGLAQNAAAETPDGRAVKCTSTVTGQASASDIGAVAAAVNSSGLSGDVTVCLTGIFAFGWPPYSLAVNPNPSVTALRIVGLRDAAGNQATIRGGFAPLNLAADATLPRLSIENLTFEHPAWAAIVIARANESVRIVGVHISGVQTFFFPRFNGSFREGIVVSSLNAAIGGDIDISGNVIDGGTYLASDTTLAVSSGIAITGVLDGYTTQPFTASVRVSNNRLMNWSGNGILATGMNDATIENNSIEPGTFANLVAGCAQPNGTGSVNGIALASVSDSIVKDNTVALVPARTGTGAVPDCTGGVILTGPLPGGAHGNVFFANRIRGTGSYAIVVGTPAGSTETNNVFALNSANDFAPQNAALFLGPGATGNVLIGNFSSIQGNAAGNVVLGVGH
jgi:hypothetical protein